MRRKKTAPPINDTLPEPAPDVKAHLDPRITLKAYNKANSLDTGPGRKGQPRGIVAAVKELTGNGMDVLQFWNSVFRGQEDGFSGRERLEASKLLFERGFGKPVETTVLIDAARMDEEQNYKHIPSELLYRVLAELAPGVDAPAAFLEPRELVAMPDVLGAIGPGTGNDGPTVPLASTDVQSQKVARRALRTRRLPRPQPESQDSAGATDTLEE